MVMMMIITMMDCYNLQRNKLLNILIHLLKFFEVNCMINKNTLKDQTEFFKVVQHVKKHIKNPLLNFLYLIQIIINIMLCLMLMILNWIDVQSFSLKESN